MNASLMNVEKIVVIGDLHHTARADTERAACWRPDGIPRLLAAAGRVARDSGAALALQIGDLVGGEEANGVAAHETLVAGAMDRLKREFPDIPVMVIPGNHDTRGEGGPEAWSHFVPPANRAMSLGNDALVLLDSNAPDETFAALPRLLAETADCRRLFVAVHYPVIPCYYERARRADAAAFFASFRSGLAAYRHFEGAGFALLESSTDSVSVSLFAGNSATPFARTVIDEL